MGPKWTDFSERHMRFLRFQLQQGSTLEQVAPYTHDIALNEDIHSGTQTLISSDLLTWYSDPFLLTDEGIDSHNVERSVDKRTEP